ncbi:DUF2835 domain-containing protein [Pseudoalteromonas sp. T1lg48]|uniref:DUF2835 domain-containing protein n=1 Tax=Pseudoalteromonas sp. T1lg48 TaxID=2077100 RepID=UPI000CF6A775|nr:DUF2835 domain-containing protein [Pseudoalteromonas sp. T1lg48]
MSNKTYYFTLSLTYEQCLAYYRGQVTAIQVCDDNRRRIRFPAAKILPHMSQLGIRGRFRLTLTPENKFVALERI